jgi:hypothetical protein
MTERLLRLHRGTLGHRIDFVSEGRTHTIGAEPESQGFDGSADELTDYEHSSEAFEMLDNSCVEGP